jgi:hypothetical protein
MDRPTVLTERSFVNAPADAQTTPQTAKRPANDRPAAKLVCDEDHDSCSQWREMYYNVGMVFVFGNVALLFVTVGLFIVTVTIKKPR